MSKGSRLVVWGDFSSDVDIYKLRMIVADQGCAIEKEYSQQWPPVVFVTVPEGREYEYVDRFEAIPEINAATWEMYKSLG